MPSHTPEERAKNNPNGEVEEPPDESPFSGLDVAQRKEILREFVKILGQRMGVGDVDLADNPGDSEDNPGPSPEKARQILSEGVARGKSLTDKQKRFFGAVAGGEKPRRS